MATSSTFYLNAPSLGSSTAAFLNSDLTVCAPDGFYSDGVIVREQVDCVLLPQQTCPSCSVPCGSLITAIGNQGVYLVNLNSGNSIGAIIVRFNPGGIPDGIRATFNGLVYNKLTSPVDGLHQSSNASNYTFIGNIIDDCGISGTTYPALQEFLYNGTAFSATGITQSVTVAPGDVSLSSTDPETCMMVIPKNAASPSIINFEMVGPCSGTGFGIEISCPVLLTGFSSSSVFGSSALACAAGETQTYYNASLDNTPGIVDVFDFVYSDNLGSIPLANGFYNALGSIAGGMNWFQVTSGVVVAVGTCAVACGNPINGSGATGIYNIDLSLGTATGAVIITFDPENIPDGVFATLNSIGYNKLSSPVLGVLQSSIAGPTYVGSSGSTSSCSSWYPSGGTLTSVPILDWNGTAFVSTGITTTLVIGIGQIKTTASAPGKCVMVIPKTVTTDLILNTKAYGPCAQTGWSINVSCPVALTSFTGSVRFATNAVPCSTAIAETYYYVKVHTAVDTYIGLYDYIFTDINGEFPLADGFYLISKVATPNKVMQVGNGVVIGITDCTTTPVVCLDCIPGTEIQIGTQEWTVCNLDVTTYRDSTPIPQVTDPTAWANLTTGAWCYYNNDPANNSTYGKLYNWYAINNIANGGLAPVGYHVPTVAEWTTLTTFLGGEIVAGEKMKETGFCHWNTPNTATNESLFTGLAGGNRTNSGGFATISDFGYWWSSTEDDTTLASAIVMSYNANYAADLSYNKKIGFSVRLIKDDIS